MEQEDRWLIELADGYTEIKTTNELLAMEKNAEEFDGFYGWRVVKKITNEETKEHTPERPRN